MTVVWDILLAAASEMQIRASDMWENHLHYILWNAMQVTAVQRNWTAHFAAQCSAHSELNSASSCDCSVSRKLEEREKVVPFMPDQLLRDDHDDGDYHHYHYNANRYKQYNMATYYHIVFFSRHVGYWHYAVCNLRNLRKNKLSI